MLADVSRWLREGPPARRIPWRLRAPLERATVAHAYPRAATPFRVSVSSVTPDAVLLLGGDLALHRWRAGDAATRFASLDAVVARADARIFNLEAQLTSRTEPAGTIGSSLRADPAALEVLQILRTSAVTCANNHCLDFGGDALAESVTRLRDNGIAVAGAVSGADDGTIVISVNGVSVGIAAFADDWRAPAEGVPVMSPMAHDADAVRRTIAALASSVDIVVLQLHWGYEWTMYPLRSLRDLARSYADAGAHIVACHHAHVPMAIERRGRSIIAHGLGNLHFGPGGDGGHPFEHRSFLLRVEVGKSGPSAATVVPVETTADGSVRLLDGRRADEVHRAMAYLGKRLDDTGYHDAVEHSAMVREGGALFLDIARRIERSDAAGLRERRAFLERPRQRLLVPALLRTDGASRMMGELLGRFHDEAESHDSAVARDITANRDAVRRFLSSQAMIGRIP